MMVQGYETIITQYIIKGSRTAGVTVQLYAMKGVLDLGGGGGGYKIYHI